MNIWVGPWEKILQALLLQMIQLDYAVFECMWNTQTFMVGQGATYSERLQGKNFQLPFQLHGIKRQISCCRNYFRLMTRIRERPCKSKKVD